jgi:pimeloyl-ACP methyl ester carboxylesterase
VRPPRGPDPSSVRLPGPWRHRSISANGIRQHVAECGDGPLVVLLHGFPEFWWAWRHQLEALSAGGYRAVAVDLRGYGDTDKPPRGYDLWTLAGDVAGLIRALGEPRADLVGHGWGGLIGWTVTALHPRVVRSLAVLGAPHPLALRRAVWRDPRGQGRALARHAAGFQLPRWPERSFRVDGGARVERILRGWSGPGWPDTDDFAAAAARYRSAIGIPAVRHCSMEYFRWAIRSQVRAEGRRFAAAVARTPSVPVLQVQGDDDPWTLAGMPAAPARWTGSQYRRTVLAGVGHWPHEELPARVNGLLAEFLGQADR